MSNTKTNKQVNTNMPTQAELFKAKKSVVNKMDVVDTIFKGIYANYDFSNIDDPQEKVVCRSYDGIMVKTFPTLFDGVKPVPLRTFFCTLWDFCICNAKENLRNQKIKNALGYSIGQTLYSTPELFIHKQDGPLTVKCEKYVEKGLDIEFYRASLSDGATRGKIAEEIRRAVKDKFDDWEHLEKCLKSAYIECRIYLYDDFDSITSSAVHTAKNTKRSVNIYNEAMGMGAFDDFLYYFKRYSTYLSLKGLSATDKDFKYKYSAAPYIQDVLYLNGLEAVSSINPCEFDEAGNRVGDAEFYNRNVLNDFSQNAKKAADAHNLHEFLSAYAPLYAIAEKSFEISEYLNFDFFKFIEGNQILKEYLYLFIANSKSDRHSVRKVSVVKPDTVSHYKWDETIRRVMYLIARQFERVNESGNLEFFVNPIEAFNDTSFMLLVCKSIQENFTLTDDYIKQLNKNGKPRKCSSIEPRNAESFANCYKDILKAVVLFKESHNIQ